MATFFFYVLASSVLYFGFSDAFIFAPSRVLRKIAVSMSNPVENFFGNWNEREIDEAVDCFDELAIF